MITRTFLLLSATFLLLGPAASAAETWTGVSLVDTLCATKAKDAPDAHTRECALACRKGGYGILAADGTYLEFDQAGNEKALAALEASTAADHLRVTVTGERQGDTIRVDTLRLQ